MKKLALAAIAALTVSGAAMAAPIGNTGLSVSNELNTYWDFDSEAFQATLSPEIGYTVWGMALAAGTDLTMIKDNEIVAMDAFDTLPVIDLGIKYSIGTGLAATAYGGVDFDLDASEFTGAKVGLKINF